MNMNPNKPEEMYLTGYGVHTDKDGDKSNRSFYMRFGFQNVLQTISSGKLPLS